MPIEELEELIYYTKMVYKDLYFKIAKINRRVDLEIDYINPYAGLFGEFVFPNKIKIYLANMIRLTNNDRNVLRINIVYTIIHELFHTNQVIDGDRYLDDKEYHKDIEESVERETARYVITNRKTLEYEWDCYFEPMMGYIQEKLKYDDGAAPFLEVTPMGIVYRFFDWLMSNPEAKQDVLSLIINSPTILVNFLVYENNNCIRCSNLIKRNGEFVNLEAFMDSLNKCVYSHPSITARTSASTYGEYAEILIEVKDRLIPYDSIIKPIEQ